MDVIVQYEANGPVRARASICENESCHHRYIEEGPSEPSLNQAVTYLEYSIWHNLLVDEIQPSVELENRRREKTLTKIPPSPASPSRFSSIWRRTMNWRQ